METGIGDIGFEFHTDPTQNPRPRGLGRLRRKVQKDGLAHSGSTGQQKCPSANRGLDQEGVDERHLFAPPDQTTGPNLSRTPGVAHHVSPGTGSESNICISKRIPRPHGAWATVRNMTQ